MFACFVNYRLAMVWIGLALSLMSANGHADSRKIADNLREISTAAAATPDNSRAGAQLKALAHWYEERAYAPLWIEQDRLSRRGERLVKAISDATLHGLEPAHYHLAAVEGLRRPLTDRDRALLDWTLSRALVALASDLAVGRVNPAALDPNLQIEPRRIDPARLIRDGAAAGDPAAWLEAQAPATEEYRALKQALASLRERAAAARFTAITQSATLLRPGQRDSRLPQIRQRLGEIDGLTVGPANADDPQLYDEALAAQVKLYQARLGLSIDGVIGPRTIESLNTSLFDRIRQVAANLERRRWMPSFPDARYILVNSAHHSLTLFDEGRVAFETRVIVGTPKDPTPELSSTMRGFQTNPYWTVPPSIAGEEYLPLLRRDPAALQKQGMRIFASWSDDNSELDPSTIDWAQINPKAFPYRVRQDPGAGNALGYIFFPFANKYGIYLHDTASRTLFAEGSRNFSHGCVRVQNPIDFVLAIYRGRGSTSREKIEAAIQSQTQATFSFPEPMALHIVYRTVIVRRDGTVEFRDDVYGRDHKLMQAMAAAQT